MSKDLWDKLESYAEGTAITAAYVMEAQQNLTGFLSLLVKINEREKIIPLDAASTPKEIHAR